MEDHVCKGSNVHLAIAAARRHHRRQHCPQVLLRHPDCGGGCCCCCGGLRLGCCMGRGLRGCCRLGVKEGVRQELLGVEEHMGRKAGVISLGCDAVRSRSCCSGCLWGKLLRLRRIGASVT